VGSSRAAAIADAKCMGNCSQVLCIQGGCAAVAFGFDPKAGLGVAPGSDQYSLQSAIKRAFDDCNTQGIECKEFSEGICSDLVNCM
jgi:hypothetical protein